MNIDNLVPKKGTAIRKDRKQSTSAPLRRSQRKVNATAKQDSDDDGQADDASETKEHEVEPESDEQVDGKEEDDDEEIDDDRDKDYNADQRSDNGVGETDDVLAEEPIEVGGSDIEPAMEVSAEIQNSDVVDMIGSEAKVTVKQETIEDVSYLKRPLEGVSDDSGSPTKRARRSTLESVSVSNSSGNIWCVYNSLLTAYLNSVL